MKGWKKLFKKKLCKIKLEIDDWIEDNIRENLLFDRSVSIRFRIANAILHDDLRLAYGSIRYHSASILGKYNDDPYVQFHVKKINQWLNSLWGSER